MHAGLQEIEILVGRGRGNLTCCDGGGPPRHMTGRAEGDADRDLDRGICRGRKGARFKASARVLHELWFAQREEEHLVAAHWLGNALSAQ